MPSKSASSSSPKAASSSPKALVGGRNDDDKDKATTAAAAAATAAAASNDDGGEHPKKSKTSIFGRLLRKNPSGSGGKGGSSGDDVAPSGGAAAAAKPPPFVLVSGGRAAAEPALAAGATWCPTLGEVAAGCDVILCCLPGDGPLEAAARAAAASASAAAPPWSDPRSKWRRQCFVALGPASRDALLATGKLLLQHSKEAPFDFAAVHLTGDADAVRRGALLAHVAGPTGLEAEGTASAAAAASAASNAAPALSAAATAELLLEPFCRDVFFLSREPAVAGDLAGVSAVLAAGLLEAVAEAAAAADALGVPRARAHVARLAAELCHSGGAAASRLGPAAAARRMVDTPTAFPAAPADACVSAVAAAARHGAAAASKVGVPTPAANAAVVHWGQVEESGGGHLDVAALASALRDAAGLG